MYLMEYQMVYSWSLSALTKPYQHSVERNERIVTCDELEGIREEEVVAYFKILFCFFG
jgi:hypothetical protein